MARHRYWQTYSFCILERRQEYISRLRKTAFTDYKNSIQRLYYTLSNDVSYSYYSTNDAALTRKDIMLDHSCLAERNRRKQETLMLGFDWYITSELTHLCMISCRCVFLVKQCCKPNIKNTFENLHSPYMNASVWSLQIFHLDKCCFFLCIYIYTCIYNRITEVIP